MRMQGYTMAQPTPDLTDNSTLVQYLRNQKLEKSKSKNAFTEADANLLLTHAIERTFTDGQVIIIEDTECSAVYRIKSGGVKLTRQNMHFTELSKGWFIGDNIFLTNKPYLMKHTLVASGTVVLWELNVPFVRQLFNIDIAMSAKFMRHLAGKYAALQYKMIGNLLYPGLQQTALPMSSPVPTKKSSESNIYKEYPLKSWGRCESGSQSIRLRGKQIVVVVKSLGVNFKKTIEFSKLKRISMLDNNIVVFESSPKKVNTVGFKSSSDREEFTKLVSSLTQINISNDGKLRSVQISDDTETATESSMDYVMRILKSLETTVTFKKGDTVFAEGDLFQRVYITRSGTFNILLEGTLKKQIGAGEIIGEGTLLHLRPSPVTLQVDSETAEVAVIPAYKINELIKSDVIHAQNIYMGIAQRIEKQMILKLDYIVAHLKLQKQQQ